MDNSFRAVIGIALICFGTTATRTKREGDIQIATTIEEAPYLQKASGSGSDKFEGYIPDLLAEIAKKINIQYEFKLVPDGKYGMNTGQEWNGMIGEVINGRARFAAAPITISTSRRMAVQFTDSIMDIGKTIVVKKPSEGEPSFENVQELSNQTKVEYGMIKDGDTHKFFQTSSDETMRKMWNHMNKNPDLLMNSNKAGIDKVLSSNGNFAFIMENTTALYYVNKNPCLMTVGGNIDGGDNIYAFALNRDDDLTEQMNTALSELKADGTVKLLQEKWWPPAAEPRPDIDCGAWAVCPKTFTAAVIAILAAVRLI